MIPAARWAVGLAVSAGLHVAAGAILVVALKPRDVPEQPMPETEMEVVSHTLDRTEARPAAPDVQPATRDDASGTRVAGGAIPSSRAEPVAPQSQALASAEGPMSEAVAGSAPAGVPLEALETDTQILAPTPATSQAAAPVPQPSNPVPTARPAAIPARPVAPVAEAVIESTAANAPGLAPAVPAGTPVQSLGPGPDDVAALTPASEPALALAARDTAQTTLAAAHPQTPRVENAVMRPDAVAAAAPTPTVTLPAQPRMDVTVDTQPDPDPARPADLPARPVSAAPPSADHVKAALAFPGGSDGVDPVSFAAFQSFMQPGDLAAGADRVRDGIAGILDHVPCSRLQVGFNPDSTTLTINGHIPDNGLRSTILTEMQTRMGADIAVSDNMLILPRPQCNALSGIASVGLPQSTDQFTNPLVIGEDTHARVFSFVQGDYLSLDMTAPDYDAVIYLDYFDADGQVLHLEPNEYSPLRHATAKSVQRVGARSAEDAGLKLLIGPPYGQEIAVAFAASHPLFDGVRPIQEPAAPYLDWLHDRVADARARHPDFKGEWVYFFVTTSSQ